MAAELSPYSSVSQAARSLLATALSCPVGAERTVHSARPQPGSHASNLVAWDGFRQWLNNQHADYVAHARAAEELPNVNATYTQEEDLIDALDTLTQELHDRSTHRQLEHAALDHLQRSRMLSQLLYSRATPGTEDALFASAQERAYLDESCRQRDELSTEALAWSQSVAAKHALLHKLEQEAKVLRTANRELSATVRAHRQELDAMSAPAALGPARHSAANKLHEARINFGLQRSRSRMVRNVFQALVLESGVNWMDDPAFASLVLSLEDGEGDVDEDGFK
ncbi:hypothetical protein CAOG_04779 [Capsaspora owczarzaki ATCC 30864]|uniref:Centromere protein H C-terminal domain-containing protein n=1 Tax=Capsaspora owczarzaki (strain ATCC 30864) TaxID=595528 RepID=A0A0D2VSK9_CAPO3|nr:hypothetical protein CAOG_04779 [Capsaspora owczarzaki ATCC 30864]KJE94087.1 hypothetical protein CAOG_004779 [Capsaspora owczarzaki ATCC 30864]|eukprot:XP_004347530.1 hypothetical protein CAOG_04779 [Capsaspora owczarzaki ATCC 30864]